MDDDSDSGGSGEYGDANNAMVSCNSGHGGIMVTV